MQQVFLSFTYKPHPDHVDETEDLRDRVSTVIESMDLRVVTGEDLGGEVLLPEIEKRIEKCDALVALVTPWRDAQGRKIAPPWVIDELGYARAIKKRTFRITHPNFANQGQAAAFEYTAYAPGEMTDTLLKLLKLLSLWRKEGGRPMEVEIAPDAAGQRFDPVRVRDCEFQLIRNYEESDWRRAKVWPQPGGLYAYLPGVPDEAKLRLRLQVDNETWQSDYQSPVGRVQDHEYAGNDYWHWRAWIDGKPGDLDMIEKVKWFLHPSFPNSVVVSRERSTGFRLETSGWGTFTLRAEVHCVDGSEQTLRQPLLLFYPDDAAAAKARMDAPRTPSAEAADAQRLAGAAAEQGVRKVFLSYAASDRRAARAVRGALETLGLTVVDDSSIGADQPLEFATHNLLTGADATVAYVSSELPSAFVAQEINAAFKAGKPTLVFTGKELGPIAGVPSEVPVVRLDPSDTGGVAAAVRQLAGATKTP
jgi:hypothetical protein